MKLINAFLFPFALFGASVPADDLTQKLSCSYEGTLVDVSTGKAFPPSLSNYRFSGHVFSWKDEQKSYLMTTGQIIRPDRAYPIVNLDRISYGAGGSPSQKKEDHVTLGFYPDANYETRANAGTRQIFVTKKSSGVDLVSDLNADPAKKGPDSLVTTTALPGGARKVLSVAQGASVPSGGLQYTSFQSTCTYTPSSLRDASFAGFFAKVKSRITYFGAKYATAKKAKDALTACLTKNPGGCDDLQKKFNAADADRDAYWAKMLSASDLQQPRPAPPHGGGGNNGDGEPRSCSRDAECSYDESCVRGSCQWNRGPYSCSTNGDCPTFESCVRGACTDNSNHGGCTTDSDCGPGFRCNGSSRCEEDRDHGACGADWQCGLGQTCQAGYCQ